MREDYNSPRMTNRLIAVLIGAFVVQSLLWYYWDFNAAEHLGLTVAGVGEGKVWQLFTFQFLHACPWPWHVLFNCLGLYFFGRPVEEMFGSKLFLKLYLLCGVAGGFLQVLLTLVLPRHPDIPVVGASAGVCGLIAIFCSLHPMQELTTWIYFFPVQIRARYLLIFLGCLSLFGALVPFDGVAHAAHLGGIVVGISYIRWGSAVADWFSNLRGRLGGGRRGPEGPRASDRSSRFWKPAKEKAERSSTSDEFISREVDPILDKISSQGFQSLTEEERKVLETARKKMSKG
jgi:membrane associated rhomboid family serine protease